MHEDREEGVPQAPLYKEILYTEAEVDARIAAMAVDITRIYKGSGHLVREPPERRTAFYGEVDAGDPAP